MFHQKNYLRLAAPFALIVSMSVPAIADDGVDSGNTAWILTSTALVLFMTLPALALFYGGLVQAKNVISVMMHCVTIAAIASVLWLVAGYSLVFTDGGEVNGFIGSLDKAFLLGVTPDSLSGSIPEVVFFMFQMTFAIITPALIVGAWPERIKFGAVVGFATIWLMVVYVPVAHWVWGGGWLAEMGVMDFAGGLVVHATAGASAIVVALMLGRRKNFPREIRPPHNPGMTMMGAGMLWVGWYGFNAGSALAADGSAGMAMTVTHISAATATIMWMLIEQVKFGKPSMIGAVTGTIAGLATITPAAGFIGPIGALAYGALAGFVCFYAVQLFKMKLGIDDSLDVFAVHGVGGIMGTLLTAAFALPSLGGLGLPEGVTASEQFLVQFIGVASVIVWSVIASWLILLVIRSVFGLRVNDEEEYEGLDVISHGEHGYDF